MIWAFFISLFLLLAVPNLGFSEKIKELTLDNGLAVVLLEDHSNPLISATVFVKVGSRHEDKRINGVSHLLEHLVFNGTERRTQERIYEEQAQLGVFEHASTGKDATIFTFLVPREKIDGALDLLSDLLFHSVVPLEKLAKEKNIVTEEIKRTRAMPGEEGARLLDEAFFRDSPYALPVLGTEEAIDRLSRQDILEYYRQYYQPGNIVALFTGDFDLASMEGKIRRFFGTKEASGRSLITRKVVTPLVKARRVVRLKAKVAVPQVNMAFMGPSLSQADFSSFQFLAEVLNGKGPAGLSARLKEIARPLVTDIVSDVDIYQGFSRLTLTAFLAPKVSGEEVISKVEESLKEAARQGVSPKELEAAKNSFLTERMRLKEQFHYFAYFNAPYFVQGAFADLQTFPARLEATGLEGLKTAARQYLAGAYFVAVILEPQSSQSSLPGERDQLKKRSLNNGMTIIAEQNRDSALAAFHLLVKGRTYLEPKDKPGVAEFLMRLLPRGKSNVMAELSALGARIKLVDDPFLSFDDYSKSRRYSELRLEVLGKYFHQALSLLARMFSEPSFEQRDVEQVRQEMLTIIKRLSQSPRAIAEDRFYAELFGNHPLGLPYLGTVESINSITAQDLLEFHKTFLSPENLILTVIADREASETLEQTSAVFHGLPSRLLPDSYRDGQAAKPPEIKSPVPEPRGQDREVRQALGAAQSYILMGGLIPDISREDELALAVAFSLLSKRLAQEVRETRGLAYSVDASFHGGDGFGWYLITMGTRRQNLDEAKKVLRQELTMWRNLQLDQGEIEKISYSWQSRLLVRLMPSINRAYYSSLSEYQEGNPKAYRELGNRLKGLSAKKVAEALKKHLPQAGILTVLVE